MPDKEKVAHGHNGVLFGHKRVNSIIFKNMSESEVPHVKGNKLGWEDKHCTISHVHEI